MMWSLPTLGLDCQAVLSVCKCSCMCVWQNGTWRRKREAEEGKWNVIRELTEEVGYTEPLLYCNHPSSPLPLSPHPSYHVYISPFLSPFPLSLSFSPGFLKPPSLYLISVHTSPVPFAPFLSLYLSLSPYIKWEWNPNFPLPREALIPRIQSLFLSLPLSLSLSLSLSHSLSLSLSISTATFPNLATMNENERGKASPQLPLSSYLFPFLENCTGPQRKIVVTSVSAEILSIPNFITLYI